MPESLLHNEKDLLVRVAEGDAVAFRQLFDHYRNKIYSLGMYLTRSEVQAEEIVQDVFLKVWEKRTELSGIQYFNGWLRTVAKNTCSNYLRDLAVEKLAMSRLLDKAEGTTASAETNVIEKEYRQIIEEAIQRLPPQQKKVYILSRQTGKKQEEIARELNISLYTVKEYLKLAQRSVRQHITNKIDLLVAAAVLLYLK
ncbi:MAG: RNA polymerase sigma-70 factor [Chitinophagaceae bacterium]|nr:RNA polymerase sigma-70 factor [Chitinophagaceae bacterium]